jgi:hypothetical protein
MVLAAERDGPDGAFDSVIVNFDAAVIEKQAEGGPAGECISDRVRNAAAGREPVEFGLKPGFNAVISGSNLARRTPVRASVV